MYDYMKALQKRFDRQSHPELDTQIKSAHEELRRDMDAAGRKNKLAAGIAGELGAPYFFDADEEEKAKEMIMNG